jgi:hypothetical protein
VQEHPTGKREDLRRNSPLDGTRCFREASHLAKAPSVRREKLFILSALWLPFPSSLEVQWAKHCGENQRIKSLIGVPNSGNHPRAP